MSPEILNRLGEGPLAIECRGVVKRYGSGTALDGLELTVPEGAAYVLVGANGAGKTTALRIVMDLVRADAGEVRIFGLPPAEHGAEVRARIGYLPEIHDFAPRWMPAGELLRHHGNYFPAWDETYAQRLVRELEVPLEAPLGTLSKGQARRVQLVQALAHRPPLLLLDEPTDGLDPLVRDRVLGLLAEHLAATPTTLLISTHRVYEVEGLADCLGVLRRGRLIAQVGRAALEEHLHAVRAAVPEGWPGAPELEAEVIQRRDSRREIEWTLWGDSAETEARLRAAGAEPRDVRRLSLEDAARALLGMEDQR